ncbi:putative DUF6594 domain-containing protein [Seiridium cardinale]|uniref:DUF6594 domain-containing protein n=1 Tax=Seiridium cardinale TaxID=138064 RepID=A0ABR2XZV2_9PEZI
MNEAGLAEQGGIPIPLSLRPGTSRPVVPTPTTAAPRGVTEQNPSESFAPSEVNQVNTNRQADRPTNLGNRVENLLPGWPMIAFQQYSRYNTAQSRKFDLLARRALIDQQTKIWSLGSLLREQDENDGQNNKDRLRKLIFDPEQLLHAHCQVAGPHVPYPTAQQASAEPTGQESGQAPNNGLTQQIPVEANRKGSKQTPQDSPIQDAGNSAGYKYIQDPKDNILEALSQRLINYYTLTILSSQVDKLPQVSNYTYNNFLRLVRGEQLEEDAWQALTEGENDFVTTRAGQLHETFGCLLHGKSWFGIKKLFLRMFRYRDESLTDTKNKYVNPYFLSVFIRVSVGLFCIVMLVGPVGILLLVPLTDAQSLGVVVGFSSLVVLVLSALQGEFYSTLIGFSTYIAVLVSSLSNLHQVQC